MNFSTLPLKTLFNNKKVPNGDVGLEIEVETNRQPPSMARGWIGTEDGSLRGYSREYVSDGPVRFIEVDDHLLELRNQLEASKCVINPSFRAGVHVHINVLNLNIQEIANMVATFWCLENALVKFCGPSREGNLFCLRLKDAEAPLMALLKFLESGDPRKIGSDSWRYAAVNLKSLVTHGSLEFRCMETRPDLSKISEWVKMLADIKRYAILVGNDRTKIAHDISFYGPTGWAEKVLGPNNIKLISYDGLEKDILSSMRNIQELIYNEV